MFIASSLIAKSVFIVLLWIADNSASNRSLAVLKYLKNSAIDLADSSFILVLVVVAIKSFNRSPYVIPRLCPIVDVIWFISLLIEEAIESAISPQLSERGISSLIPEATLPWIIASAKRFVKGDITILSFPVSFIEGKTISNGSLTTPDVRSIAPALTFATIGLLTRHAYLASSSKVIFKLPSLSVTPDSSPSSNLKLKFSSINTWAPAI